MQLGNDVVWERFHLRRAVLDGQAFDGLEFDLAALYLGLQDVFQHPHGLTGDERPDAIAAANADTDVGGGLVVEPVRFVLESLDSIELFLDQGANVVTGAVKGGLINHSSTSLSSCVSRLRWQRGCEPILLRPALKASRDGLTVTFA